MSGCRRAVLAALFVLATGGSSPAESLEAVSTTAMGITGDIDLDDSGIIFENGARLAFSRTPAEEIAVEGRARPASVYEVAKPSNPELNGGNTLCGDGAVTYLATWPDDDGEIVWLAAFTSREAPVSTDDLCASFTYVPKR